MSSREDLVSNALLAEQAERYDDLVGFMKKVTAMEESLSSEERNLLSVGYKNKVGARRSALRIIGSMEKRSENDENKLRLTKMYKDQIAEEMKEACQEFLDLIETHLIPKASDSIDVEAHVFALKLKGDYYRYIVEVVSATTPGSGDISGIVQKADEAYNEAMTTAENLPNTHPIKLGLVLNFSVFHYEIAQDNKKACELAKQGFDNAVAELDSLKEDNYKDATLVMQLLRDNLTLWTSEQDEDSEVVE